MIGKITGIFSEHYKNMAIIDIRYNECCVGYEVFMKNSDIESLQKGDFVTLYIKEIIKEEDDVLYGFLNFEDKCWFEELIKLSGLGPKSALIILSTYSCENITEAILSNNCDFFSSITGIGSKLANRIPNEMKKNIDKIREKVINFDCSSNSMMNDGIKTEHKNKEKTLLNVDIENNSITNSKKSKSKSNQQNTLNKDKNTINSAIEALIVLGFSKQKIYNDVFKIAKENSNLSTEEIVKKFLQTQQV